MEQELLKNNFERHGFKTSFFDTKKAALDYLKDQISGKKVAIGGCVTAQEMIPEAVEADEPAGVISVVAGFALMMALDVAL